MREVTLKLERGVPRNAAQKVNLRHWFERQKRDIGIFGSDGQSVGIGFVWQTNWALAEKGIDSCVKVLRSLCRGLRGAGVLSPNAMTYILECRVVYTTDVEPTGILTIREGVE